MAARTQQNCEVHGAAGKSPANCKKLRAENNNGSARGGRLHPRGPSASVGADLLSPFACFRDSLILSPNLLLPRSGPNAALEATAKFSVAPRAACCCCPPRYLVDHGSLSRQRLAAYSQKETKQEMHRLRAHKKCIDCLPQSTVPGSAF